MLRRAAEDNRIRLVVGLMVFAVCCSWPTGAGVRSKAIRELAEALVREGGKEVTEESLQAAVGRLERFAVRFGDDGLLAARRTGPQLESLLDGAGDAAPLAVELLARHGEDALWIARRPKVLHTIRDVGQDATTALLKHQSVAQRLLGEHGLPAAHALNAIDLRNGRRLAMLQASGDLQRLGRAEEVLDLIGRLGDRAMDFVWRNKGALTVGAALTAFLADPEPFLNGTHDLASVVGGVSVRPLAEVPGKLAEGAAQRTNWTLVVLVSVSLGAVSAWLWLSGRKVARVESSDGRTRLEDTSNR